jgi:hypothetical protein
MENNSCVVVLGMHRSGTSALAGCLNILGLNLGNALMAGGAAEEGGYFENRDIVLAHDILLRDLGCRWDMVGSLPEGWIDSEAAQNAAKTLTGILERQFLGQGSFVVKDPRLCRLMPLWMKLSNPFGGIRPSFVLMVRHPMEVARSLEKRDGFDLLKSHLLWMVHNREALQACQGKDHVIVTFDQVLADPLNTLCRIGDLPSLPGFDLQGRLQDILGFIQPRS